MTEKLKIVHKLPDLWALSLIACLMSLLAGALTSVVDSMLLLASVFILGVLLSLIINDPPVIIRLNLLFLLMINPVFNNYMPLVLGVLTKEMLIFMCLAVWIIYLAAYRKRIFRSRAELAIVPFAIYALLNAVLFRGMVAGILAWRTTTLYAFVYFTARDLFSKREDVSRYLHLLQAIGVITIIVQIAQFLYPDAIMPLMGWDLQIDQAWRTTDFGLRAPGFITASHTGLVLAVVLTIQFGELIHTLSLYSKRQLIKKAIILIMLLVGILLTASRGSLVGLAIGVAYLLFRFSTIARVKALTLILLGIVLSWAILGDYWSAVVGSLWGQTPSLLLAESSAVRARIYTSALESFRQAPLFGHGLTVAGEIKLGNLNSVFVEKPHSYILKLLEQTGVIGFGLWVIMVCLLISKADRMTSRMTNGLKIQSTSIIGGLITFLGCNIFNELLEDPAINVFFWSLLGVLYATLHLAEKGNTAKVTL